MPFDFFHILGHVDHPFPSVRNIFPAKHSVFSHDVGYTHSFQEGKHAESHHNFAQGTTGKSIQDTSTHHHTRMKGGSADQGLVMHSPSKTVGGKTQDYIKVSEGIEVGSVRIHDGIHPLITKDCPEAGQDPSTVLGTVDVIGPGEVHVRTCLVAKGAAAARDDKIGEVTIGNESDVGFILQHSIQATSSKANQTKMVTNLSRLCTVSSTTCAEPRVGDAKILLQFPFEGNSQTLKVSLQHQSFDAKLCTCKTGAGPEGKIGPMEQINSREDRATYQTSSDRANFDARNHFDPAVNPYSQPSGQMTSDADSKLYSAQNPLNPSSHPSELSELGAAPNSEFDSSHQPSSGSFPLPNTRVGSAPLTNTSVLTESANTWGRNAG